MTTSPVQLPEALRQLPPMPQALMRALELTRDDRSRRSELARVLSLDPALSGHFLRMVNSAYYGLPRRITSLDEAIGYLGYEAVEEVIFAIAASSTLSRPVPSYMLDRDVLWQHSVAVAEGAAWIAERRRMTPRSDMYVAGLLHDVGKLALDVLHQRLRGKEVMAATTANKPWTEVERQLLGKDHAEVGAVIVRTWNLPDRVVEAIACHHSPSQATLDPKAAAVVHLADGCALMAGIGLGVDGLQYTLDEAAVKTLDWNEQELAELMDVMSQAVEKAKEILRMSE